MAQKEEKASEFIERYTKEHPNTGQKYIDAVGAITELYARLISEQRSRVDIVEALSDAGGALQDLDKRVKKLEGDKPAIYGISGDVIN